jgi:hypothetical protein
MDVQLQSAIIGFAGGVLSTIIITAVTMYMRYLTDKSLESDEIRKRRVEIVYNLLGSRYVLTEGYSAAAGEVQVFNTAMSAFSVYFTNDSDVRRAHDRFMTDKSDQNLALMLLAAAKVAQLDILDSQMTRTLTVPAKHVSLVMDANFAQSAKTLSTSSSGA